MDKKTLVIGASSKPERYAFKAIHRLVEGKYSVEALALKAGNVAGVDFRTSKDPLEGIHTVTLYVSPRHQPDYYEYILSLRPKRVIFNPGTENAEFQRELEQEGIEALEACTLVLLATNQY